MQVWKDGFQTRGNLSRREIIRNSLLGGAAAFGTTTSAFNPAWAQAPRKGGVLRFCRPDGPDTLDPQVSNSFSGAEYGMMIYDALTKLDQDGQPLPELATSWQAEKGGQEWIVNLREGVKFHSGDEFSAADVIATVERSMDRARAGSGYNAFGPVREIRGEGKYRVRFILNMPFGEFPVNLAYRLCRILPEKNIDGIRETPNGTGAFTFTDFQPGSSITVTKNPNYWNAANIHLDGVRMVFIREAISMQAALRSGQVDVLSQVPVETYLIMNKLPGFKAYSETTGDYHSVQIQGNMPPFNNLKVRHAFRYILDRKATVASVLFGQGSVGNDVTMPPGNLYLPELPQHEQNLPLAKRLLEESGVGPISLDFYTSSDRLPAPKMVLAFAEAASKIGVNLRIRDIPYTEYAANVARKMPLYTGYWSGAATLYDGIYRLYHTKGANNYAGIESSPGLDTKIENMIAAVDLQERKKYAAEVAKAMYEDSDRIIPYFRNYIGVTSNKVQGFVPPKYGVVDMRGISLSA